MPAPIRVLFVCTGNICRSLTAHCILLAQVERLGLAGRIAVDSAAITAYHIGEAPDPRTQAVARVHGVELSALRARQIGVQDFLAFTHIIALDRGHLTALQRLQPNAKSARLSLLLDVLADCTDKNMPDPYYGGPGEFEHVFTLCERACTALLSQLLES